MALQTPKIDWKAGDVPNSSDFNRIEENTKHLYDTVHMSGNVFGVQEFAITTVQEIYIILPPRTELILERVRYGCNAIDVNTATIRALKNNNGTFDTPESYEIQTAVINNRDVADYAPGHGFCSNADVSLSVGVLVTLDLHFVGESIKAAIGWSFQFGIRALPE
jgi:hypothetical protein